MTSSLRPFGALTVSILVEAVLVLVDVDPADLLDGFLYCHDLLLSLRTNRTNSAADLGDRPMLLAAGYGAPCCEERIDIPFGRRPAEAHANGGAGQIVRQSHGREHCACANFP